MNHQIKGAIYGIIASIAYGTNPLFALPVYEEGISTNTLLFYRFSIAAVLLGIILKCKGEKLRVTMKEGISILVLGLLFGCSSLFLFESFRFMDVGIACTILFVYPIMVAVIMGVFFHEKQKLTTYLCILLSLCGIGLLYNSESGKGLNLFGLLLVFLSSLSYAIYMVGVNHSPAKQLSAGKLTFWALIASACLFMTRLNFLTDLQLIRSWTVAINVGGIVLIPTIISLVFISLSIKYIGSTYSAILGALEPVTAIFIGLFVFHEKITFLNFIGILLIFSAVMIMMTGEKVYAFLLSKWNRHPVD